LVTKRKTSPTHRSKYAVKVCHFCGQVITEAKWVTKQAKGRRDVTQFRRYHTACWDSLFI
jgi:hypothetical protein